MHKVDVEMGRDLYEMNRKIASRLRSLFDEKDIVAIDFMGSIGSGKTLVIEKLIELLKDKRIGVIVGDVTGDDDYKRIKKYGVQVVNINTGKECHLDAHLIEHAVENLNLDDIQILFMENIGNLVCPADFELGSHKRGVVISVTEGDDMVRKHPLIFQIADFIVINKIDLIPYMEIDMDVILKDIQAIAPKKVFLTNARSGEGIRELAEWLVG
ncbi:MAG: hydrogenase accessory protein HypB [Thermoplasmata archaeon]|nr:MAG: hydrogenase accessory protein HypB [Thermoplasmata archaeon]RLF40649.1 MAG: hydrogenase accessory protein HypB [Thermoplasmata archaeon]RLF60699.1 MAG: hydrogenase accessory protein HypB [Thermoplasmata archaeon]